MNTAISAFPWLCSTTGLKDNYSCYNEDNGSIVSKEEGYNAEAFSTEAYGTFGLKLVYYKVSENLKRDKIYGEDQLQVIERAFNTIMYTESIPPNVRTYQLQGIWGEDVVTCYVGINAFKYWSTYGNADRNTPMVYEDFQPRIGDVVYMEANDTFYEIRDVKYYQEAFGLTSHTYTLTLKVYKDTKLTIDKSNPTIPEDDPIYQVATSDFPEQYNTNDVLKKNPILDYDALVASQNVNHMDVIYNPNKGYDKLVELEKNINSQFNADYDKLSEIYITSDEQVAEMKDIKTSADSIIIDNKERLAELHNKLKPLPAQVSGLSADIEVITYTDNTDVP